MIKKRLYPMILLSFVMIFMMNDSLSYGMYTPISANSAIVMDVNSGRVLYQKGIHDQRAMASTTKIMTALLAVESGNLNRMIKIPNQAVGVEGSSIYLKCGEKMSMKDLVYGLMLRSGNDAAEAIAISISGSIDKFAQKMNERAKKIGAVHTHFANPHGLPHDNHYTTAYDLALIAREALKNKDFQKVVSTKLWVADREGFKHFYNKNKTLTQYEGGNGVKTGYTKAAGRCLVTSATRDDIQLVCVVLNDPNWFVDSYNLLDECFLVYKKGIVAKKNDVITKVTVEDGKKECTHAYVKEDIILPLSNEEKRQVKRVIKINKKVLAPIVKDEKAGKINIYLNDQLLYTTDLFFIENVESKTWKDHLYDYLSEKGWLKGKSIK